MTNILIIASRSDIAGGENYLLSCLKYMDRNRYHPIVWLPGDGVFRTALEKAGVEYMIEPVNYGWLKPPKPWYEFLSGLPGRVRRIADLIRERDIRLVHTNSNMILEGALAARVAGVPHLYLAHIDFQSNMPLYQRFQLDAASFAGLMGDLSDGIIAVSHHVARSLCPPLDPDRIRVVHNGLELDKFDQALAQRNGSLRRELGLPADAAVITAAGRITEDKGFDILLEAAAIVHDAHPDAHFLIAGGLDSPDYQRQLTERIVQLGLGTHVHFLGLRKDLPRVLTESDIFLLTSRREGHPYVLLEAMACECAVVASRCGGVDETVIEGETGFVVEIGDVTTTANRLDRLLSNPELRNVMAHKGLERVKLSFTALQTADGLFKMYDELLSRPALQPGSYAIDLFLQTASEIGCLGEKVTDIEERLKKAERAAQLLLDNPLTRLARRIFGKQRKP
ncbi:MAG: glycosyltransferase family 4 protein [Candidatus Nitrotoga sp.]|nr:glycosyltransferase family 4 protein [Candidatus Nitrotoga sp.]